MFVDLRAQSPDVHPAVTGAVAVIAPPVAPGVGRAGGPHRQDGGEGRARGVSPLEARLVLDAIHPPAPRRGRQRQLPSGDNHGTAISSESGSQGKAQGAARSTSHHPPGARDPSRPTRGRNAIPPAAGPRSDIRHLHHQALVRELPAADLRQDELVGSSIWPMRPRAGRCWPSGRWGRSPCCATTIAGRPCPRRASSSSIWPLTILDPFSCSRPTPGTRSRCGSGPVLRPLRQRPDAQGRHRSLKGSAATNSGSMVRLMACQ